MEVIKLKLRNTKANPGNQFMKLCMINEKFGKLKIKCKKDENQLEVNTLGYYL